MIKDNTGIIGAIEKFERVLKKYAPEEEEEKTGNFLIKCLKCNHEMVISQFPRSIIYRGEITFVSNEDKTEFECDMCGNKISENNKC